MEFPSKFKVKDCACRIRIKAFEMYVCSQVSSSRFRCADEIYSNFIATERNGEREREWKMFVISIFITWYVLSRQRLCVVACAFFIILRIKPFRCRERCIVYSLSFIRISVSFLSYSSFSFNLEIFWRREKMSTILILCDIYCDV